MAIPGLKDTKDLHDFLRNHERFHFLASHKDPISIIKEFREYDEKDLFWMILQTINYHCDIYLLFNKVDADGAIGTMNWYRDGHLIDSRRWSLTGNLYTYSIRHLIDLLNRYPI